MANIETVRRKRSPAFFDFNQSLFYYEKVLDSNPNKKLFHENASKINDLKLLRANNKAVNVLDKDNKLPPVPQEIKNSNKQINLLSFDESASIIEWFDECTYFENALKAIDFKRFISDFTEDDFKQMKFIDVYGFDIKDYEILDKKFRDLKALFKDVVLDKSLYEYYKYTRYDMDDNKENMKFVHQNFDKIEKFAYIENAIKFFMNTESKGK